MYSVYYAPAKENRIYIRVEFRESLRMNFVSPFQPQREFKVYKSCKCSQIICSRVDKYSMFHGQSISISNFLKLLNKLYKMNKVNKKHHLIYNYNGKSSFVK